MTIIFFRAVYEGYPCDRRQEMCVSACHVDMMLASSQDEHKAQAVDMVTTADIIKIEIFKGGHRCKQEQQECMVLVMWRGRA